jgi:UDP-N-acetylglucosamine pyrophosphorylase
MSSSCVAGSVLMLSSRTESQAAKWRMQGLQLIKQGKVALLLLAGGQGVRLGSHAPKVCIDLVLLKQHQILTIRLVARTTQAS